MSQHSAFLTVVLLLILTFPASVSGAPPDDDAWFMAGANPQRTSWVAEGVDPRATANFGVEWYRPIEAYISQHVQLITARGKIYVSTARGLYALEAATGDTAWRFDTELPLGHSPTVVDGTVFVGGLDKRVYALNADTGALLWQFAGAAGGFSANPLVVDGRVMLGSRDGYFYTLNANTGALLWQYPAAGSAPLGPILYSAAWHNGRVYFAANNNRAYALDAATGGLVWQSAQLPGDGFQAWWPVVYGNHVIFSTASPYVESSVPGTASVKNVVDPADPYYNTMHQFQYGTDLVKTLQRDDVFHQNEPTGSRLGPEFIAGGSGDNTGLAWSWEIGSTVIDGSKVTAYLEDDGQTLTNRPVNKPWRRSVVILNAATGSEFTFDSDGDNRPEYAPFLLAGTKSGNRYPPLIIPTQNAAGQTNDVIYAQNFERLQTGWGISRARLTGWQFGTPYLRPVGPEFAIDEPFAPSAGGSMLYTNLCCDRMGRWDNLGDSNGGTLWDYNHTLESIKLDWSEVQPWMTSVAPGYDEMWYGATMWSNLSRLTGNYGTVNGLYHNHGLQNPIIPYDGRLFVHRSNGIIAFGPNPVALRQRTQNETPEQYEANIQQEYPQLYKPRLAVNAPDLNQGPALTVPDVRRKLDDEISKMLQTGHLQPGYYNGTRNYQHLANYFENPGDTLYTLLLAWPHVSALLKPNLEKYIKQHYRLFFEDAMYGRTGFQLNNPPPYNLNNPADVGQLQPRAALPLPPEITVDMSSHGPSLLAGSGWPWSYPQHNIYAMWMYAKTFHADDPAALAAIYNRAKSVLDSSPPDAAALTLEPWVHNAYIAAYQGFLNLQTLAGQSGPDATLRATIQAELNTLLASRANHFEKDTPWESNNSNLYKRTLSVARNFMFLTPELGDYLHDNAFNKVKEAVDEYNWIAPYWVVTRYEATQGEFANDNLYTHPAMLQANALILQEPGDQLLKYLDAPAFPVGDLHYIQNLAIVLDKSAPAFLLSATQKFQAVETGGQAIITIQIEATNGFTQSVTLNPINPAAELAVQINPTVVTPPGQTTLTLTDLHTDLPGGVWYTIPLEASGGGLEDNLVINLLVNGKTVYLPLIMQ